MVVSTALKRLGGVARTRELRALGVGASAIRTAHARGEVCRVRKGVYATATPTPVTVAAQHGGTVACVSALAQAGVWLLDVPVAVHIDVGHRGRTFRHPNCACVTHRHTPETTLGTASCAEALLVALHCLNHELFFAAYESAWRQRLISADERTRIIHAAPAILAAKLRRARPNADSGLESIFRYRLLELGIELESQVKLEGVGRIDFRHGFVLFEIDGKRNHDSPSHRHKDLLRDATAIRLGYRVVRFDYAMIIHDWSAVVATVMAAINLPVVGARP